MKKILSNTVILVFLFVNMAYSSENEIITVTANGEFPPISWQDKDNPKKITGVSIELLEMAFREKGISVEAKYVGPWKRAQLNVQNGEIDMLAAPYINEERQVYFDYIFPAFMEDPVVIFVKKGQIFPFEKWEDLIGMTGGTPLGNSYGEKFDKFAKEKLTIEWVSSVELVFRKLEYGRNRYLVYGLYSGLAEAQRTGFENKIEYLPNDVSTEGMYMAFSKKSPFKKYIPFLGQKMKEYKESKIPEKLVEKYLKIWKEQTSKPAKVN